MEISNNVSWKILQDRIVAVNVDTGAYYTMNTVASYIWQQVSEGKEEYQIVEALRAEYPDISDKQILADLKEQLSY